MKKTDLVTKIAAVLVFLALASYMGVYFWRSVKNPVVTAIAVETKVRTAVQVSGIIVRDEQVIESDAAYMSLQVADGERVAKESAIAVTYDSEEALQRAGEIQALEAEIRQVESVLDQLVNAEELSARDTAIQEAILELSASVARHSLSDAETHSLNLRSLLFSGSGETATAGDLILLRSELEKLLAGASADTAAVTAPESGIFTTLLDGYEHLEISQLQSLTPADLTAMQEDVTDPPEDAIGKLVCSGRWYFAALMSAADFDSLETTPAPGDELELELGRYYGRTLTVRVEDVGREEDGGRVLVLSCNRALADTLAMRMITGELVLAEHSGIRVPKQAVYTEQNDDGETVYYVYTLTGVQAERKNIQIVWETEEYYLAAPEAEGDALREGNDIIVSAKDLYDGKIME